MRKIPIPARPKPASQGLEYLMNSLTLSESTGQSKTDATRFIGTDTDRVSEAGLGQGVDTGTRKYLWNLADKTSKPAPDFTDTAGRYGSASKAQATRDRRTDSRKESEVRRESGLEDDTETATCAALDPPPYFPDAARNFSFTFEAHTTKERRADMKSGLEAGTPTIQGRPIILASDQASDVPQAPHSSVLSTKTVSPSPGTLSDLEQPAPSRDLRPPPFQTGRVAFSPPTSSAAVPNRQPSANLISTIPQAQETTGAPSVDQLESDFWRSPSTVLLGEAARVTDRGMSSDPSPSPDEETASLSKIFDLNALRDLISKARDIAVPSTHHTESTSATRSLQPETPVRHGKSDITLSLDTLRADKQCSQLPDAARLSSSTLAVILGHDSALPASPGTPTPVPDAHVRTQGSLESEESHKGYGNEKIGESEDSKESEEVDQGDESSESNKINYPAKLDGEASEDDTHFLRLWANFFEESDLDAHVRTHINLESKKSHEGYRRETTDESQTSEEVEEDDEGDESYRPETTDESENSEEIEEIDEDDESSERNENNYNLQLDDEPFEDDFRAGSPGASRNRESVQDAKVPKPLPGSPKGSWEWELMGNRVKLIKEVDSKPIEQRVILSILGKMLQYLTPRERKTGQIYAFKAKDARAWHYVKIGMVYGHKKGTIGSRMEKHVRCYGECELLYPPAGNHFPLVLHALHVEKLIHQELIEQGMRLQDCPGRHTKRHKEWFDIEEGHAIKVIQKWCKWISSSPYEEIPIRVPTPQKKRSNRPHNAEDPSDFFATELWKLKEPQLSQVQDFCVPLIITQDQDSTAAETALVEALATLSV